MRMELKLGFRSLLYAYGAVLSIALVSALAAVSTDSSAGFSPTLLLSWVAGCLTVLTTFFIYRSHQQLVWRVIPSTCGFILFCCLLFSLSSTKRDLTVINQQTQDKIISSGTGAILARKAAITQAIIGTSGLFSASD